MVLISNFLRVFKYCLTQSRKSYNNRCHSAHIEQAEAQQESAQETVVYSLDTLKAASHQCSK